MAVSVVVVVFRRRYIVAAVLVALLQQQGCLFVCLLFFEARCLFVDFLVLYSLYEHMLTVTGSSSSMWCSFACVIIDPLFIRWPLHSDNTIQSSRVPASHSS